MMERVSDDILEGIINDQGNIIAGSWNAIHYLLVELQARRKAEKDGAEETQEKAVLPIPCTKGFEDWTIKKWFQKINEELDEMKNAVLVPVGLAWRPDSDGFKGDGADVRNIAEEAADTITSITSMLEAMGIDEQQRQAAQRRVNERNKERDRL